MSKHTSLMVVAIFAAMSASPAAIAQVQKREQEHKGTAAQGTVQKQDHKKVQAKDKKQDGSGEGKQAKGSK